MCSSWLILCERERVACHVGDLVRAVRARGATYVAIVDQDRAVPRREGGHLQRPGEHVGRQAHETDERLALAVLLVIESLAVRLDRWHRFPPPRSESGASLLAGQPTLVRSSGFMGKVCVIGAGSSGIASCQGLPA